MKNLVCTLCYYYASSYCLPGPTKLQYELQCDLGDLLTAHSSKTCLLLKVKYLFYQMAISNKYVSTLI